jgi:hypothetical protein
VIKLRHARLKVFIRYFLVSLVALTLILALPETIRYFLGTPLVTGGEGPLKFLWIVPLCSALGGLLISMFIKKPPDENTD